MKLNIRAFALTCGISWAILVFILSWCLILFIDTSSFDFSSIDEVTKGYRPTPLGSFVASFLAGADGLIFGIFFAWVHNILVDHFANEPKE